MVLFLIKSIKNTQIYQNKIPNNLSILIIIAKNMKNAFYQLFRGFDLFTAPAGLRIHSSETLKSSLLGFISILIFGGLIYILVVNWIGVMNYEQINFQLSETMISGDQAQGEIRMAGVTMGFVVPETFEMYYDFHWNYYQDGKLKERLRMVRCRAEQWKDLGQNYNKTFYSVQLNDMYCPNVTTPYKLKKTLSQQKQTYVSVTLSVCDKTQRPGCYEQMAGLFMLTRIYAKVWFYYLDTQISPTSINSTSYFVNTNKAILTYQIKQYVQLSFTTFQIQTDMSIWPIQNTQIIQGSQYDTVKNNPTFYDVRAIKYQVMAEFVLAMNNRIKIYQRTIGKVDQIVAYVGGLFGIALAFSSWFLISYNKYRFQIKVAEGAFNYDQEGNKIKESSFNFFTFIKYAIYLWFNKIFCCKLKWKSCNEIDDVRQQINKQMDVSKMFLRLQAAERAINYKIQDNEQICINLIEPPTLAQVRQQRIQLDYYDEVIKGNSAATLEDLLKQNQTHKLIKQMSDNSTSRINSAQYIVPQTVKELEQPNKFNNFNKFTKTIKAYNFVKDNPQFKQTLLEAQKVKLNPEFDAAQDRMANYYQKLDQETKEKLDDLIPMLILHRFNMKIHRKKAIQTDQAREQRQKIVFAGGKSATNGNNNQADQRR